MAERQIVDRAELRRMTPAEVVAAESDGRLELLKRGVDLQRGDQMSDAQWVQALHHLTPEQLAVAADAGLLEPLTARDADPAVGNADQGARGGAGYATTRELLRHLSPDEIAERLKRGDLDPLLRGEVA